MPKARKQDVCGAKMELYPRLSLKNINTDTVVAECLFTKTLKVLGKKILNLGSG